MRTREDIAEFESTLGQVYNFFNRSAGRLSTLKYWQDFLDLPELKFKHLFDIRCSSIRGCLKPIISNVEPGKVTCLFSEKHHLAVLSILGHQALFATLKQISEDQSFSLPDRKKALRLYNAILNDSFLFYLHFHYDLQECVSGHLMTLKATPPPPKKSIFVKKMKIEINAWEDSPSSALSETL